MRNFQFFQLVLVALLFVQACNSIPKVDGYSVKSVKKRDASGAAVAAATAATVNGNAVSANSNKQEEPTPSFEAPMAHEDNNVDSKKISSGLLQKCDPCPDAIVCVPQIQCPAHVRMRDHEKPQVCDLPGGKFGYCCISGQNHTATRADVARFPATFLPPSVVEEARKKFEHLMHRIGMVPVQRGRPDFMHGMVFHSSPQEDIQNFQLSNSAMEQVITSQVFSQKEQIPLDDIITNNIDVEFKETPLAHHCSKPRECRNPRAHYRTFDGSCNNALPHRSHWGAAGQPMERLLPPAYEDGIWTPRAHSVVNRAPLMGAREVSRILLSDIDRPHPRYNLLVMQFGQFIAHDVSQSASVRLENGDLVECCTANGGAALPRDKRHFACMPIDVAEDDEFFADFNVRCMNFVRLSLATNNDCKMGYGKQRSKVTHFLDASPVYGSSKETARELRTFRGGQLRMFNDFGRDLLPLTNDKKACESDGPGKTCFKSGDGRTNQIISLIAIHILFAREHNRIAKILAHLNPNQSDEQLYQEARRIVIAEMQHIIYNEYLPAVVGPMQMKRFRLVPQHHGYSSEYRNDVNPAITNEFSGAAFRMGHSSVDGKFHIHKDNNRHVDEIINIPDVMFNPSRMRKRTFYDDMLRTLVTQPMQKVDSSISHGLSRFLFRGHNPFGLDLAAFNVQRGRDQGLRGYNDYLEVMGHRKIHSFNQLPAEIGHKLAQVYRSPDDIDLWIGGLLEKAVEGGIVGITFAEIIADQFSRFKHGDRYFYEYNGHINPGAFSIDQLHELRKASMARLICDNADHLTLMEVPPAAFVRADVAGNRPLRCDSSELPFVDLEAWRI